eukprot:358605-Chlamydomonas_euryale.AAC.5
MEAGPEGDGPTAAHDWSLGRREMARRRVSERCAETRGADQVWMGVCLNNHAPGWAPGVGNRGALGLSCMAGELI